MSLLKQQGVHFLEVFKLTPEQFMKTKFDETTKGNKL